MGVLNDNRSCASPSTCEPVTHKPEFQVKSRLSCSSQISAQCATRLDWAPPQLACHSLGGEWSLVSDLLILVPADPIPSPIPKGKPRFSPLSSHRIFASSPRPRYDGLAREAAGLIVFLLGDSSVPKLARFAALDLRPSDMSCSPPSARSLGDKGISTLPHSHASLRTY